jgi:hypothetical protein
MCRFDADARCGSRVYVIERHFFARNGGKVCFMAF